MEQIVNWIVAILKCNGEICSWSYRLILTGFAMLFLFLLFVLFSKKGKYCYGRWLGHKMAIRIGLSIALGFLLLAIPFMLVCYNSISLQENEIASGLIQSIGTIITGIGVVAAYVLQSDENNRQNTLKYTTESRSKWMDDGRQLTSELGSSISEYVSYFSKINSGFKLDEFLKCFDKLNGTIPALYMRFNFNGARDRILLVILNRMLEIAKAIKAEVDKHGEYGLRTVVAKKDELQDLFTIFVLHLQIYYKVEWERLKKEVKYVGNVEARDYYIKEEMVDLRNTCYRNQIAREGAIFKDGIPEEILDISVFTIYLKLMGAKLEAANELDIVPAKLIELEQKEKIRNLAVACECWKDKTVKNIRAILIKEPNNNDNNKDLSEKLKTVETTEETRLREALIKFIEKAKEDNKQLIENLDNVASSDETVLKKELDELIKNAKDKNEQLMKKLENVATYNGTALKEKLAELIKDRKEAKKLEEEIIRELHNKFFNNEWPFVPKS